MQEFLGLCTAFISGCADFFNLPFPGLGIPIYTVFIAFLVADIIVSSISIVFGVNTDGSHEFRVTQRKFKDKP